MQRYSEDKHEESHVEPEAWLYRENPIPHYYGDTIRALLIAAAVIILVGSPFYVDDLAGEMPFFVIGALALVAFAAFTSPRNRTMLIVDALSAGIGAAIFEVWALFAYGSAPFQVFILRQVIALLFLFAFYYSTKSVRALVIEHPEGRSEDAASEEETTDSARDENYENGEVEEEVHPINHHRQLPEDIDD